MAMESQQLCIKMRHDLGWFETLHERYLDKMLMVRYEDYIPNINTTLHRMYGLLGEVPPLDVQASLMELTHSKKDGPSNRQERVNGTASLYNWASSTPKTVIAKMTESCKDVLQRLGYPLENIKY